MGKHHFIAFAAAAVVVANLLARAVCADQIVLQNGRTFDGEIVAETGRAVTLEIFVPPGYTMQRRLDKAQIRTWQREPHDGVPYVVLPVFGVIGEDVTADALRAGLAKATATNPRYIILAIDSDGGDIGHMNDMVDAIIKASKDTRIVAYVKKAYSAAAVVAMCCHDIYLKPDAVIGAAVPFRMTENGPADVDAKFRSAFQAKIRASTAQGGHADLLIRGMSEPDLEIFLAAENGKPTLRTSGPGKQIKRNGQILTLTAKEAAECGLARIAPDMADLGKQVAGGPWYAATKRPWNAVVGTVALAQQHERDVREQQARRLARQTAIERIRPEADAIMQRARELIAQRAAVQSAIDDLNAQGDADLAQIDTDYKQSLFVAQYQADPDLAALHALEVRNSRAGAASRYLNSKIAALRIQDEAARVELIQLNARMKELLDSIPSE